MKDPLGAVAIIYALLLDADQDEVRTRQVEYIAQKAGKMFFAETQRVIPLVDGLKPEARLPLVAPDVADAQSAFHAIRSRRSTTTRLS